MNYWVNVHDPPYKGESRKDHCKVYLQAKNKQYIKEFNKEDFVFIYETEGPREAKVEGEGGVKILKLAEGKKGIIALVRIISDFIPHQWKWRDISFIGHFDTEEVNTRRKLIPLQEIRKGGFPFNPRINGGLRKLKDKEFKIMARLVGFRED